MESQREVINTVSQDKHHEKFGVVVEVFNFLSKFWIFKGAHEISDEIRKKIKIFDCNEMTKRGIYYCFSG